MEEIQQDVVSNVRTLLKLTGRTQAQLAAATGIGESGVSKRFSLSVPLDLPEVVRISDFFGNQISPWDLIQPHDAFRKWVARSHKVIVELVRESGVLTRPGEGFETIGCSDELGRTLYADEFMFDDSWDEPLAPIVEVPASIGETSQFAKAS